MWQLCRLKGLRGRSEVLRDAVMRRAGQSINLNVRRRLPPTCNFFRSREGDGARHVDAIVARRPHAHRAFNVYLNYA